MTLHIVLDHSALIPCGDKPEEEKQAIVVLGDLLPECDVVWHVSKSYLKTLCNIMLRSLKYCHPLPRLLSSLARSLRNLIEYANRRLSWCVISNLTDRLKLHVVARAAFEHIEQDTHRILLERFNLNEDLTHDDLEVLALAILTRSHTGSSYIITADRKLLDVTRQIAQLLKSGIIALTPSEFISLILGT